MERVNQDVSFIENSVDTDQLTFEKLVDKDPH